MFRFIEDPAHEYPYLIVDNQDFYTAMHVQSGHHIEKQYRFVAVAPDIVDNAIRIKIVQCTAIVGDHRYKLLQDFTCPQFVDLMRRIILSR